MVSAEKLFEQAKQLEPREVSRLVALLEEYLTSIEQKSSAQGSYARTLAASGTARSDWTDVSSHKGKHLAEIYATKQSEARFRRYEHLLCAHGWVRH